MFNHMFQVVYLFLLAAFLFFSTPCVAAPTVELVENKGNTLNISGAGFGLKTPAAPILWENFEDGAVGDYLPTTGKWVAMDKNGGEFSSTFAYSGNLSAYNRVTGNSISGGLGNFNTSYFTFPGTDKLYYSYQWRMELGNYDVDFDYSRAVVKAGRMGGGDSPYNGEGTMYISAQGESSGGNLIRYDAGDGFIDTGWHNHNDYKIWHRHEMFKSLSNPSGTNNGQVKVVFDNNDTQVELNDVITRKTGYSFKHESVLLGLMAEVNSEGYSSLTDVRFYVDDVYVDKTMARVEIGDSESFNDCTRREPQIPYFWDDNKISVSVNNGSFVFGDNVYVFVVDENGIASDGYQITLITTDSSTPSLAPSPMLRIESQTN